MTDERIPFQGNGLDFYGLYRRGSGTDALPLIVLLHGGGATSAYFDNPVISSVGAFANLGYDVLNISRPGYGNAPVPTTSTPLQHSIPAFVDLIDHVRTKKHSPGVILVGHSLGGALALSVAYEAQRKMPIWGVSCMGSLPTQEPLGLLAEPDPEPENPRYVVDESAINVERFMGKLEWVNLDGLSGKVIESVFEPGLKSELREYESPAFYQYLTETVIPGIGVPVQFLAAENEVVWDEHNASQGRTLFNDLVSLFQSSTEIEAEILPRGGHNYEFSKNARKLLDCRNHFIQKVSAKHHRNDGNEVNGNAFTRIPILDYKQATQPESRSAFLEQLQNAVVNVGFFYLQNTGVPDELYQQLFEQSSALFNLPLEKKLEIEMVNSKHFLGYSRLGQEITALKNDYREQFDFATEFPAPLPEEPLYRNIRGPNQWPDAKVLPQFRSVVETYIDTVDKLASSLTSLVAEALDLPPNAFDDFFDTPQQNKFKMIKYPEPADSHPGQETQGVGPHKDSCFLTFLLQGTPHTGLEVQNKAGTWLPVHPIPGTLVINIGRALEAITGGVCTATTHRVNLRPESYVDKNGRSLGPRFSFAVFQGVSLDLGVEKIHLDIPHHIKELVKDEKVRSDAEATFNQMFNGNIGQGTLIARITSHQDVAERWYPDLLKQALKAQEKDGVAR
ncbi:Uncharacterized protein PECH_004622 [Penicillium ucsense]|uniref:Fe2OG dioxygenase domain-containing protein n=1 Tax=Penicillium ucsense TaxID=2839758 RepID=A0A8J8WGY2_9EURO|nr:Uncharacterized protein PECM_006155 [Penicillium ucsense]KAF7736964.1 Uncharacterized protein PECH_004622 [Penicillium ucsense]